MSKAAELAALIGSQTALSNRNLIINGAMQVSQRGDSTGISNANSGYYGPDRYKFNEDGTPKDYNLKTHDSWGLIYKKGDITNTHQHYPCLWSWTYCVNACEGCSPLVFPTSEGKNEIEPENGQLIMWPSHVLHEVPKQVCSHERVMIAGDIIFDRWI